MDFQKICMEVVNIARETGNYIRTERMSFSSEMVEIKGLHNFVSHVDKQAENQIVASLRKLFPEAGFIAEEGTGEKKREAGTG
jgi:myo-inositol-1(or 4)-monophosphatase